MKRKQKIPAARNPFVALALKRKAGAHRKSNKAVRQAEEMKLKNALTKAQVAFVSALSRWRNG